MKVALRLKLAFLLLIVGVVPLAMVLTGIIFTARRVRLNALGKVHKGTAVAQTRTLSVFIHENAKSLYVGVQGNDATVCWLHGAKKLDDAALRELDAAWPALSEDDPRLLAVMDHPIGRRLTAYQGMDAVTKELIVTDRYGQLVAASQKTEDFYQADEAWWQGAYADGDGAIFIPQIEKDPSAGVWSLSICFPIVHGEEICGITKAVMDVSQWFYGPNAVLGTVQAGGVLADETGRVIYPLGIVPGDRLADWSGPITDLDAPGWRLTSDGMFEGYAPVTLPSNVAGRPVFGPRWILVLRTPEEEVMAEVNRMTWLTVVAGLGLIVLIFLTGLYAVDRSIGRRVRWLESAAMKVAQGDLTQRVDQNLWARHVLGTDEIDDLADEFNRMVDRVESSHRELAEANKLKSDFIKVAGHELRTPVSYILTLPKLMADTDDVAKLHKGMATMESKARRLNDIIQAMFKLMPEKEYSDYLNLSDVDMHALMAQFETDVEPFLAERHQILELDIQEDLPRIRADRDKLRDIAESLIGNAIKFTPDGGLIRITVVRELGGTVALSVIDQGPGISAEDVANIFNPFFSTGDVMKHSSGAIGYQKRGMGLGLAVVKHFAEMHNGTVSVDTGALGSTFTVHLPIDPAGGEGEPA